MSRRAQRISEVATAIDVITGEEILRSGATTIPDALRLATGMHVARSSANGWAISARGFNTTTANKMQVLMDGRSLYSPLYSGVFWDVQHYLLEDIDRIEVIRGPGATIWGANSFNGVINIITRGADQTQGTLLMGGGGSEEQGFGGVRYGGKLGENTYYRAYATYFNRDGLKFGNGLDTHENMMLGQTGFRIDSWLRGENRLTLQGDYYHGNEELAFQAGDTRVAGGNLLGRWSKELGEDSDLTVQFYYDKTYRKIPGTYEENRDTFDLDLQHGLWAGARNFLTWGFNYRLSSDEIASPNPAALRLTPPERNLQLFSAFVQDEITLVQDYLGLTVGSKFEHNDFSGFEVQPSARIAYTPTKRQTLWAGISRAVRTPTRIDVDFVVPGLLMNQDPERFESEEVLAYELGYRVQPVHWFSLDIATFYNVYDNIRSVEPGIGGAVLRNEIEGDGYGVDIGPRFRVQDWWAVKIGYTYLNTRLHLSPESRSVSGTASEGNDPQNIFVLHSSMDFPYRVRFDQMLRYVDELTNPAVPSYLALDLRVAWEVRDGLEISVVGQNLLDDQHPEFGTASPLRREVEQSVYGKVTWRF